MVPGKFLFPLISSDNWEEKKKCIGDEDMLFSESDRFAPSLISLKTYNLLLILEPHPFFLYRRAWYVLKCCRNQWRPAFLNILCFVFVATVCFLSLLALLPMTTTFMHHSYSNDDNKHHLLFFRGKHGRTRKKREKNKPTQQHRRIFLLAYYPPLYPHHHPTSILTLNNTDEKNRAVITDCWYEICTFWSLTQTTIHRVVSSLTLFLLVPNLLLMLFSRVTDDFFFFF